MAQCGPVWPSGVQFCSPVDVSHNSRCWSDCGGAATQQPQQQRGINLNPPPEEATVNLSPYFCSESEIRTKCLKKSNLLFYLVIRWRGTIPARASRSQPKESSSGCCHRQQLALLSPYICHGVEGAILIQITNKMFIFPSLFSILTLF